MAGRPIGSQNKTTTAAKEAFQLAFNKIGGVDALVKWAHDNTTDFYKLYGRLIPVDMNANHTGGIKVDGTIKFVRPDDNIQR